jgi:hypothetical protein
MGSVDTRLSGQSPYNPQAREARSAWREEMLGRLLGQMRERQLPSPQAERPAPKAASPHKGYYLDIYV